VLWGQYRGQLVQKTFEFGDAGFEPVEAQGFSDAHGGRRSS
jgi:hypothetical protein